MNERLHESISALVDNAGDDLELRRLLAAMETDDALRRTWHRYHVIGAVLRRERVAILRDDVVDREHPATTAAVTFDGDADVASSADGSRLRRYGGYVAVASVAAVAVAYWFAGGVGETAPPQPMLAAATPAAAALAEQRARAYILQHVQQASMHEQGQVAPFVKVVAFEP